jgi:predicted TIM-barrel fold metal-dependent hydrolase
MAEPQLGTAIEYEDVLALAEFPHVTMKMSGLAHFSHEDPPYLDVHTFVQRVAEAFGPDHLAWSGMPLDVVDVVLADWSEADRAKVKGDNLAALAGWNPAETASV